MKVSEFIGVAAWSALVSAGVSYGMSQRRLPPQPVAVDTVEVPSVVGVRPEQAKTLLEARGLLLTIAEEKESPQVEPGKISQQNPLDGSRVRRGETVRVDVARAPATIPVPNVVGRSASKAKEILSQAGFTLGAVQYRSNDDRSDGIILEQAPAAGQNAVKGSRIDLAVNRVNE
ncbi:MAG TPA: PASTA domain-containing protein [Polyangia bacterium]|nr:PASTA domain-containing protein [Polyangia bacterium]